MTIAPTRRAALAALVLPLLARPALAQEGWPRRAIRIVVPYNPGGATDSSTRAVSDRIAAALGQPVVIENRTGASGQIGGALVAQAPPDGHTFLMEGFPAAVNPFLLRNPQFDYRTAFVPVVQFTRLPLAVVVRADLPARDLAGLLEMARRRPGEVSWGFSGNGTAAHLAGVLLQLRGDVRFNGVVYRGGTDAVRDLAAGSLDMATVALLSAAPTLQGGRARLLAVTTARRSPLAPDTPTTVEAGLPDSAIEEWIGLFAPAGTPQPVLDRMAAVIGAALREPDVQQRLAGLGVEPVGGTQAEFAAQVAATRTMAEALVREARLEPG